MHSAAVGLGCAIALFLGCLIGLSFPCEPWADLTVDALCAALLGLSGLLWVLRRRRRLAMWLVLGMACCIGVVRAGDVVSRTTPDHVAGHAPRAPTLVRFRARMLECPSPPDRALTDVLDRFQTSSDEPTLLADAELVDLQAPDGVNPARGIVTLVMPGVSSDLQAGDLVQGTGWLLSPRSPTNPGERDQTDQAWRRGWVGRVTMECAPELVQEASWLACARTWMQRQADRNLVRAMHAAAPDPVTTLVVAMTTGRRQPGYASLRATFARTGLSHFLAISGFNVAVLLGAVAVCMEALRVPWWARGCTLTMSALLFLVVVDVEVSVLRAGLAGVLAGVSLTLGRGWRADGLLSTAAVVTLIMDPWMARNTGFQLSYAAVLALRHLAMPVDRVLAACWPSCWCTLWWLSTPVRVARMALSASIAAWLVSTPITILAFGSMSPWCAIASTMLGPVAAVLTVVASAVVLVGWLPVLGSALGWLLWTLGHLFLIGVTWVGTWPWCSLIVVTPAPQVAVATDASAMEWIALDVGDGSAHILRCGERVVVYDAGSISRSGAGSGVVVPALRALGVSRIDCIVVTHPHLDHFSAVPEIVQAMPVGRVIVSEAWRRPLDADGAPACLLAWLADHAVPVVCMVAGDVMQQGALTWRCVHPAAGWVPRAVNDGSLGFTIHHERCVDRPVALLLGDAQDESIAACLARSDLRDPLVMELPHHGGWRPIAEALCAWVRPAMVVKSTGPRRHAHDRFDMVLRDTPRGVTCADGALRFSVDPARADGAPRLEHWQGARWEPLH